MILKRGIYLVNDFLNRYLFLLILIGIYISFHLESKIISLTGLNLTIYDFYIFFIFTISILFLLARKIKLGIDSKILIILYFLISWHLIETFRALENYKALTLCLILMRDYFILFITFYIVKNKIDLSKLNKAIVILTSLIALIFNILFVLVLENNPSVEQLLVYELERGSLVRLEGLAGDPNFYGLLLILPINILWFNYAGKVTKKLFLLSNLFFSLLSTVSRSSLLLLGLQIFIYAILSIKRRREICSLIVVGGVLIGLLFSHLPILNINLWNDLFSLREKGEYYSDKTRLHLISELGGHFFESPVMGIGLRGSFGILGRNAHNSWLESFVELGIVGGVIIFTFIFLVLGKGIKKAFLNKDILPWSLMWVNIIIFMFFFSYFYHPFLWFTAGVILGVGNRAGKLGMINNGK